MAKQRFSQRTNWETAETEWATQLRERRAAGLPVLDLTASNPTRCGFAYDSQAILSALSDRASLVYDPNPQGLPMARAAVADYYRDHGAEIDADRIVLTTSTSEAYSFLFRLLCDPGNEVLVAQPSYPLFEFLADLDDVRLVAYPLFYDFGWHLDGEGLRRKITPRTRAIAVVHPNNPTGHFTKPAERKLLEEICREHGLALIVDEVFLDYSVEAGPVASFAEGQHPALTFVLSGLSKIAALPQMKASWIVCLGAESPVRAAIDRLEVIADTFLSMNAPVQAALPSWLAARESLQSQIRSRVAANLAALDRALEPGAAITRLRVEAGWNAVLRIPALESDQAATLELLRKYGVAIQAGGLFGFGASGWLVASLLTREEEFYCGINYILTAL